jgi:hypothetical protein
MIEVSFLYMRAELPSVGKGLLKDCKQNSAGEDVRTHGLKDRRADANQAQNLLPKVLLEKGLE